MLITTRLKRRRMKGRREKGEDLRDKKVGQPGGEERQIL
jgi:hypothetical protein